MKPKLVIKLHTFPTVSETFIVSNIIEAINKGYDVKIIVEKLNAITQGSQAKLLEKYNVMSLVSEIKQPQNKLKRIIKAFQYALNPVFLYYFIKYCRSTSKISLSYLFRLKFYSNFKSVSLFHVHFATNASDISNLKKIGYLKSKLMVTFHGFDAHYKNEIEKDKLKKRYQPLYSIWDKVTVNTVFLKENVLRLGCQDDKINIVPMAIDLNFYSPKAHPKTLINNEYQLVSIGRLIPFKGHEFGIRTVKKLIENGLNINYTIVGYGKLYDELKTLIQELNLENNVFLFGKATQVEIKDILENAHLFLMTSITDETGRQETQGVVSAEAQAMGLPIAGFNSGGVPYTVTKKTSILVEEKNTEALAHAVMKIFSDKNNYITMSIEAKKWANKQFGLKTMIARYYNNFI